MMEGELIVRWTARLAVACYLARLAIDSAAPPSQVRKRHARVTATRPTQKNLPNPRTNPPLLLGHQLDSINSEVPNPIPPDTAA